MSTNSTGFQRHQSMYLSVGFPGQTYWTITHTTIIYIALIDIAFLGARLSRKYQKVSNPRHACPLHDYHQVYSVLLQYNIDSETEITILKV